MDEEDNGWRKPLLLGLGALVVVALLVGAVVGVVALGAANLAGLGGGDVSGSASQQHSLYVPPASSASSAPTTTPASQAPSAPAQQGGTATDASPGQQPSRAHQNHHKHNKKHHKKHHTGALTLSASTSQASTYQRIYLSGSYPGHDGTALQVQRREGGTWSDFPVTAVVRDGGFRTYVQSGHGGVNRFRVVDTSGGTSSPPVSVTLH